MSLYTNFDHYDMPVGADGSPYGFFEALRDEAAETGQYVGWSENYGGFWLTTGWNESRAIHVNTKAFSNVAVTFPPQGNPSGNPSMLSGMDDPDHKRYRAIVQGQFTTERANEMEAQLRAITNDLIDTIIEAGRADACSATDLLPERAATAILGLHLEDGPKYRRFVHAIVLYPTDPEAAAPVLAEMETYWTAIMKEKRENPTPGLLSEIINSEYNGVKLNDTELLDFFSVLLLGGLDNTARFFGNVFWRLATDPALRRELVEHPELVPFAVEEFLRLDGPACVFRLVLEDIEIGGVQLKKDQVVGLFHPVTNRDPRQFDDPDTFVIERSPNRHFSLGTGVHRCLGLNLVKVEARILLQEFLRRIPEFELDPEREPRWISGQVGAMHEVPIVFTPGSKEGKQA